MTSVTYNYINIPNDVVKFLKLLEKNGKNILVDNFYEFYNLKSEGKFDGHENEYVLIENGRLTGFYNTFSSGASDAKSQQALVQPVKDTDIILERKRMV